MKKLVDIGGIYTNSFGEYEEENYLFGRILVDDNNNFEGTLENNFSNNTYFVFGSLDKTGLEFIIGNNETEAVPKKVTTHIEDDNSFDGNFYATDGFNEIALGECRMIARPADQTREVTNYELSIVDNQIKIQKEELGETTSRLYNDFLSHREIRTGLKK